MMDLFHDTGIWLTLSFSIFLLILWKTGKSAILSGLDKRIEDIRQELETSENLRIEAQELLAQYQRKHRDAMKESQDIIATAEQRAAEIRKKAEADLDDLVKRREQQLQERLSRMKETVEQDVRQYASEVVIKATEELIAQNIKKKDHTALIDQAIKSVANK